MSYQRLLDEAMTPQYEGSKVTALCSMLRAFLDDSGAQVPVMQYYFITDTCAPKLSIMDKS